MARSDRILLSSIKTLTLYADKPTNARRTAPVPQLDCAGSLCRNFQPDAIQCTNAGGSDIDIDWKCEADLPSSLRFGRLQVSCEGWDRPGDPFVLKGSCGLTYSLVRVPQHAQSSSDAANPAYTYLSIAACLVAIYLLLAWLLPRFINPSRTNTRHTSHGGGGPGGSGGFTRGGGPTSSDSGARHAPPPPPPYTKYANPSESQNTNQPGGAWAPGFWTGLGAGGLAAASYHYLTRQREPYQPAADRRIWDWERTTASRTGFPQPEASAGRRRFFNNDSGSGSGAGSSTGPGTQLGEMRRATGFGGSSVR